MSYDALVWLLVGLGVGVAGSMMLLLGYVTLEHRRLGRRLRRGTTAAVVAPAVSTTIAKPAAAKRPVSAGLSRPVSPKPVERKSVEPKASGAEPRTPVAASPMPPKAEATIVSKPEPKAGAEGGAEPDAKSGPARPALSLVSSAPPKPVIASDAAPPAPQLSTPTPITPRPLQSVEAMFAEAFANDRLPVSPESRDEAKPPKP
ncbi:hypothetical protein [Devosia sp. A16]|uniref:hypothetical protein n=1 Tax=Devosia sp. A16 TaxID=1736675 RepID=UPI0006D7DF11|nr:hypothetical protein [Devosia sp. A16]